MFVDSFRQCITSTPSDALLSLLQEKRSGRGLWRTRPDVLEMLARMEPQAEEILEIVAEAGAEVGFQRGLEILPHRTVDLREFFFLFVGVGAELLQGDDDGLEADEGPAGSEEGRVVRAPHQAVVAREGNAAVPALDVAAAADETLEPLFARAVIERVAHARAHDEVLHAAQQPLGGQRRHAVPPDGPHPHVDAERAPFVHDFNRLLTDLLGRQEEGNVGPVQRPLHRPDVATPGPSSPGEEPTSEPKQWSVVVIHRLPLFPPRWPVD